MADDSHLEKSSEADLLHGPAGEGDYVVKEGDCLASLAYARGLYWRSVWSHPRNAALKKARKNPNVLLPGDRVHLPELEPKDYEGSTDKRHKFVRKGVPEMLRFVLRDEFGKARANVRYRLVVDGTPFEGT